MARLELFMHVRHAGAGGLPSGQVSYYTDGRWYLCRRGRTGECIYKVTEYTPEEEEYLKSIEDKEGAK